MTSMLGRIGSGRAPSGALFPVRRLVAAMSLLGAAGIHAAVTPEHLAEWVPAGLFFAALAVGQGVLAMLVLRTPRSRAGVGAAAITLSLAAVGVWALARAVGVPFGPHAGAPEAAGVADLTATLLELVTIGALSVPRIRRPALAAIAMVGALVVAGLTAGTMALGTSPASGERDGSEMCPSNRPAVSYLDHSGHHGACAPR